jgi:hypothetical protein
MLKLLAAGHAHGDNVTVRTGYGPSSTEALHCSGWRLRSKEEKIQTESCRVPRHLCGRRPNHHQSLHHLFLVQLEALLFADSLVRINTAQKNGEILRAPERSPGSLPEMPARE